jgi:HlyD family secretion protein
MNRARIVVVVALLAAAAIAAWWLFGRMPRERLLSGYIEGENLYLSSPVSGTVGTLTAIEGQRVAAGQALFSIDPATLAAQGEQAQAGVAAAKTQIASAAAQVQQAEADVAAAAADAEKARRDLARLESVRRDDSAAVAGKDLDAARAALKNAEARVAASRKTADARRAQVAAAQAQANEAVGSRREVDIRVGQLSPAAPTAARVEDVFFQKGEWVTANQPVVALLPDEKVKVRFYVPEKEVSRYRAGTTIRFSCDACAAGMTAVIRYVSPRPEFTPPVIFSRASRDRLVFMVEAYPKRPANLQPGLPVDVEPLP